MNVEPQRKMTEVGPDQAFLKLGEYLLESGYHFTTVTPATHERHNQRIAKPQADNLRDILGWSRPFARATVTKNEFELMHNAGILVPHHDLWHSTVRWSSLKGMLFAHSAYPTDASDAVFFGPDTYRFADVIELYLRSNNRPLKRVADIGCGSGAGAVMIGRARPESQVLAIDINHQALRLTDVNVRLARVSNVEPAYSDLLKDVPGRFDLIVANPPYMVDSRERAYRHGGGELGAGLSLRIVEEAMARLAPGGVLLLYTGIAIVDGQDPFLQALHQLLDPKPCHWHYREIDPDVFGEELTKPAYARAERIAAVALTLTLQDA